MKVYTKEGELTATVENKKWRTISKKLVIQNSMWLTEGIFVEHGARVSRCYHGETHWEML